MNFEHYDAWKTSVPDFLPDREQLFRDRCEAEIDMRAPAFIEFVDYLENYYGGDAIKLELSAGASMLDVYVKYRREQIGYEEMA